jgi:hypothetical protein
MQLDMHFYGTYAMARAAGFAPDLAETVATAAQYVDDAASDTPVPLRDGSTVVPVITSSHKIFATEPENRVFQWRVWMPFHFLPGGAGEDRAARLICRQAQPGEPAAEAVLAFAAARRREPLGPALLGVTCHVVEDTFSHYGFAGADAQRNRIERGSIVTAIDDAAIRAEALGRLADWLRKADGHEGGMRAGMGHLSAGDLTDRPHVVWRFRYAAASCPDAERESVRDNRATYLAALARVHAMCADFAAALRLPARPVRPFDALVDALREILGRERGKEARCDLWLRAMRAGQLFDPAPGEGDGFPRYDRARLDPARLADLDEPRADEAWRFIEAARAYQDFVLNDLVPGCLDIAPV